jgi:outer membrane protein assembly factor BamE (lipoprotein component of BamABCDE complex)
MFFCFKNHFNRLFIVLFIILAGCQLQEPTKNHGIMFLENRSNQLIVNKSNKNDVIKIIGQPHSKSINDDDIWIYLERTLTKGKYHKLGKHVLKKNNTLLLKFDKFGILKSKKIYDKNNTNKIAFSEKKTKNELSKKSFVESFLSSVKQKMYGNRK